MLTPSDLIRIPYTPDLTQAGILYACRALASGLVQAGNRDLEPLRSMVSDIAAALAFRRCLAEHHMPYLSLEAAPFSQPGLEQVVLSGRGCHLVNRNLDTRPWTDSPTSLCAAPATLRKAHLDSDSLGSHDLLVFTFTIAQPDTGWDVAGRSNPLIYLLPAAWQTRRQPGLSTPGKVSFESTRDLLLEIGGLGMDGKTQIEDLQISAYGRASSSKDYSALAYLAATDVPPGKLSVLHSETGKEITILPGMWGRLGLQYKEIILAGYTTVDDFRRRARRIRSASRLYPGFPVPSQAISLPVADLQTLSQLFAWVKQQL